MIYAYFLYVHFVLNLIVGIYFLVTVRASNRQELVDYCAEVFVDTSVESSCTSLMSVSTYVFIAIVAALLLLELCESRCFRGFALADLFLLQDGVLIATRYVYRLRIQKRDDRSRRLGYFHALSTPDTQSSRHTRQASDNIELLRAQESTGDPQDFEDGVVLDIRPQSYMPVSTHDRDLLPAPAPSTPPYSFSDTTSSGRRIRALPPRPVGNAASPDVTRASSRPQKGAVRPVRLPNPHEPLRRASKGREPQPPDSEDEQHSLEVSTNAHSALMDHAKYMESMIFTAPVPNLSQRSLR